MTKPLNPVVKATKSASRSTSRAVKRHPAGTVGGTGGILLGWLISQGVVTQDQAGALVAAGGLIVTAVSWVNAHGGIIGLWNDLLHGSDDEDA